MTSTQRTIDEQTLRSAVAFGALLILTLLIAWCVYRPGLSGAFLFDDYANLPALGAYGPVDNGAAFWRYVTSGTADPTGRPLALLSFLIDARSWPTDPAPFKRTGVLLHLLNGILLTLLLLRLGRVALGTERHARAAALLGSTLWLLHPLFVSTTLYVVQREAMLPATFVLLGLIGYVAGRTRAAAGKRGGAWLAAIAIVVCTLLAVASKANGALLPLLAWLTETLLLAPKQPIVDDRARRDLLWLKRLVLTLPSALLLAWLVKEGVGYAIHGVPDFRAWTFCERLLTQPRVVTQYLGLLLLPHPYTAGLFNDGLSVSTGLLSPPSTLVCLLMLTTLFAGAVWLRRRAPLLALAVLFYFTGQLLESTVIPLELYYEHRNYLPALLLFWPLAAWLTADGGMLLLRRILAVLLPLLLATMTWMRADLWGDVQQQAAMWATKNPASPRAQAYAAQADRARGNSAAAIARLVHVPVAESDDIQIVLNLIGARCDIDGVGPTDVQHADAALRDARITGQLAYAWFGEAIDRIAAGHACPGLGANEISRLLDAAQANRYSLASSGRHQDNLDLRGRLALALKQPDQALAYFDAALDADPNHEPGAALAHGGLLASAGYYSQAMRHLDHLQQVWRPAPSASLSMASLHAWLLRHDNYWQNEIAHMRAQLADDLAHQTHS